MMRLAGFKVLVVVSALLAGAMVLSGPALAAGGPDLAIAGTSNPATVSPAGGKVAYVLSVSNVGTTTVKASTITDTAPAGATFVAGLSDACWTAAGASFACTLGSLAPGASLRRVITFTTPSTPGTIANVARITAKSDNNPSNDTASTPTGVAAANPAQAAALLAGGEGLVLDTVGGTHQVTLPPTAALVTSLARGGPSSICGGPCESETITLDFPLQLQAALDRANPVRMVVVFDGLSACGGSGTDTCHPLYYFKPSLTQGLRVPFCPGAQAGRTGSGQLGPDQNICLNYQSPSGQQLTYDLRLLSDDPSVGAR